MPSLIQGRIVFPLTPVPDPQGRNAKPNRPFVVVSSNSVITGGGPLELIGITSENYPEQANDQVDLPTGPHTRTKLKEPWSAALCTWKIMLRPDQFRISDGFAIPKVLFKILEKLKSFDAK